jgi:hypothetical protein
VFPASAPTTKSFSCTFRVALLSSASGLGSALRFFRHPVTLGLWDRRLASPKLSFFVFFEKERFLNASDTNCAKTTGISLLDGRNTIEMKYCTLARL